MRLFFFCNSRLCDSFFSSKLQIIKLEILFSMHLILYKENGKYYEMKENNSDSFH